jgi:hypothetical protein
MKLPLAWAMNRFCVRALSEQASAKILQRAAPLLPKGENRFFEVGKSVNANGGMALVIEDVPPFDQKLKRLASF